MPFAADLANDRLAAVDPDTHPRPIGMLFRELAKGILERESGAGSSPRVVGLVAPAVEDRYDAVADELLHHAAEPTGQERGRRAPVRLQHDGCLDGCRARGEACVPDQVAEEHADVLVALSRRRQVEVSEALLTPFPVCGVADDQERRHDQAVPLPPARMPLALTGERDAYQRLGEEYEAGDDGRRQ